MQFLRRLSENILATPTNLPRGHADELDQTNCVRNAFAAWDLSHENNTGDFRAWGGCLPEMEVTPSGIRVTVRWTRPGNPQSSHLTRLNQ